MKRFVCFTVCFMVGLFACQQIKAQDAIDNPAATQESQQLLTGFAECETDCVSCETPVKNMVMGVVSGVSKVKCRTMTVVKRSVCRAKCVVKKTRCHTKSVLSNARRLTQRMFVRLGCGCN